MPNRDFRNNVEANLGFYAAIGTNTTTTGQIVDTADYDGGIMFSFAAVEYDDGTFTPLFEESEDGGATDPWTAIPDDRLIGTPAEVAAALVAAASVGDVLPTIGLRWCKKDVRLRVVSTGIVGTGATIVAMTHKIPEIKPVE